MGFSKILCAVNSDPLADAIFDVGLELAEKFESELALVSIIDRSSLYTGDTGVTIDELRTFVKRDIEELFTRLTQRTKSPRDMR